MNPEAIEWLEGLDGDTRVELFTPVYANEGLAQMKDNHETTYRGVCRFCDPARRDGTLVVIS